MVEDVLWRCVLLTWSPVALCFQVLQIYILLFLIYFLFCSWCDSARVHYCMEEISVPSDPYVFGPPGSGSISQRYGSRSRSFYHQAKIARKTLIPTVWWLLFDFLSLKNDVNVPAKSNKQKKFKKKISFWLVSWRSMRKLAGSDPHQNVMDPQHWKWQTLLP